MYKFVRKLRPSTPLSRSSRHMPCTKYTIAPPLDPPPPTSYSYLVCPGAPGHRDIRDIDLAQISDLTLERTCDVNEAHVFLAL